MLDIRLQIFIIATGFLFAGFMFYFLRKELLELRYSLIWIISGTIMVIISLEPELVSIFSKLIGIKVPVNALFLMSLLSTLIILFTMTISISKLSIKVIRLAQELAILKSELEQYKDKNFYAISSSEKEIK